MPRASDRDDEDDFDEADYSGFDTSDPDDDLTAPCPYCGAVIYEESEQCTGCGKYLTQEDAPAPARSTWIFLGVVICLVIVACWIIAGM